VFKLGAAVLLDANEDVVECGADPAAILGFAAHENDKNPITGKTTVAVCTEGQKFWMSGSSAPVKADINQVYGIVKDANGIWIVDKTEAVNTRVYIHAIDTDRNLFLISVLAANRQALP
jgi:hypothetical protein